YFFFIANLGNCEEIKDHRNWKLIPTKNCGKAKLSNRIVGGEVAALGQFPWISRLAYVSSSGKEIEFNCAGSLINELFVVTAAHCLKTRMRKRLRFIRLGENYLKEKVDCDDDGICAPLPQDIEVNKIIIHEKFNFFTFQNDIALISLKRKAKFNGFVQPICLPQESLLYKNFTLTGNVEVAGWGETESWDAWKSYYSSRLKYVALPIQDIEKCNRISNIKLLDESQYCVGEGGGKDSCTGDSGGPMMKIIALNAPPKYFLFGVVSQGTTICGQEPGIYTKLEEEANNLSDVNNYDSDDSFNDPNYNKDEEGCEKKTIENTVMKRVLMDIVMMRRIKRILMGL
ncbi:hypothetical protein NQ314_019012, partial [Rhamnusium bicolor]